MLNPSRAARLLRAFFVLALCLLGSLPALGAAFTLQHEGETRSAEAPAQMVGGAEYVPLDALVQQFGGSSQLDGRRVQVRLADQTAILDLEQVTVYATQTQFDLGKAVIAIDNRPYIPLEEVPRFFEQSFAISVVEGAAAAEPQADVEEDPEVDLEEELMAVEGLAPATGFDSPTAGTAPAGVTGERLLARRIVIDPGHGGYDTGYISPRGLVEKDLALAMAQALGEQLKQKTGLEIYFTRSEDTDASIRDRVQSANEQQADLFVSLHGGASFSQEARGLGLYYQQGIDVARLGPRAALDAATAQTDVSDESAALAEAVAAAVRNEPGLSLYGVHAAPLRLFDRAGMPGLLVEVGFLSNPEEEQLLLSDTHRNKIAAALADGIVAVLRQR